MTLASCASTNNDTNAVTSDDAVTPDAADIDRPVNTTETTSGTTLPPPQVVTQATAQTTPISEPCPSTLTATPPANVIMIRPEYYTEEYRMGVIPVDFRSSEFATFTTSDAPGPIVIDYRAPIISFEGVRIIPGSQGGRYYDPTVWDPLHTLDLMARVVGQERAYKIDMAMVYMPSAVFMTQFADRVLLVLPLFHKLRMFFGRSKTQMIVFLKKNMISGCSFWLCVLILSSCSIGISSDHNLLATQTPSEMYKVQIGEIQEISMGFETQDILIDAPFIWVLAGQQVTALDLESLVVEHSFQENSWSATAFIKADNLLWILNDPISRNGFVTEINVNDGNVARIFEVGRVPKAIEFNKQSLWVANFSDDTVTKIRVVDDLQIDTFSVGRGPMALAFDGISLWVANSNENTVMLLNPETGEILKVYSVGKYPSSLLSIDNGVWVAHLRDNRIMKLDPNHYEPVSQFAFSSCTHRLGECGYSSLAFDGDGIWAVITETDEIIRFDPKNGLITNSVPFSNQSAPAIVRYAQHERGGYLFAAYVSSRYYPQLSISRVEIEMQN